MTCPSGALSVTPDTNLGAVVKTQAAGTVFCLEPGTYTPTARITLKSNQQLIARQGGAVVFKSPSTPSFPLFDGHETAATGVVIRGLVVDGFGSSSHPAVRGNSDWVIERNEILNATVAVNPGEGNNAKVLNNYIHHSSTGIGGWKGRNALIQENEVAFNTGDQKFVGTIGTVVRGNYYHDNSAGIWMDGGNAEFLIENNLVVGTRGRRGIENEAGCSGVIRNNWAEANDKAGIMITASQSNEVYGNMVKNNENGIVVWHQDRRSAPGSGQLCDWWLKNISIHDNTIVMKQGYTGLLRCCGVSDDSIFSSGLVTFDGNTYRLGPNTKSFQWMNGLRSSQEWRSFGMDVHGEFLPL